MPCTFQLSHPLPPTSGCQFAVAEAELIEFDGKTWCPFHLPLRVGEVESAKAQWDEVRITQFTEAIFARIDAAKRADGVADLSGVVFPAPICFERYSGEEASLPSVQFERARFGGDAEFRDATFGGDAWFRGARFDGFAGFERATFSGRARFVGARFDDEARFVGASFGHDAMFVEAMFGGDAAFTKAVFCDDARFVEARFSRAACFTEATFGTSMFFRARFSGDAKFERTMFGADARFDDITFGGTGWFWFRWATFEGGAYFPGDPAHEGADAFPGPASFRGAKFKRRAVFNNRRFLQSTDFREAVFTVAPEFHNAVLHQDTRFAGTDFRDRKGSDEVDAAMAYRTLKLAMASVRATDEEARFYGYEQQSLRARKDTSCWVKLLSWLYEQTADYGQNSLRPLLCWFATLVFFWFVYYFAALVGPITTWADITWADITWADMECVSRFALQQVFQPFSVFRTGTVVPGPACDAVPLVLALLGAAHSILSFSFLALFLLALRRRFRLN